MLWKFNLYRPQRSYGKEMFLRLSIILFGGGVVCLWSGGLSATPPWEDTPSGRQPPGQTSPGQTATWADTPRQTPPGRPLWADTPLGRHPLGRQTPRQTPQADTPWANTHTPGQTPPIQPSSACWDTQPLRSACWHTVDKRAICIPLECILVFEVLELNLPKWTILLKNPCLVVLYICYLV